MPNDIEAGPIQAVAQARSIKDSQMPHGTLKLAPPFGKTGVGALLILAFVIGLAETLAREQFIQAALPAPSLGTAHYEFEYELMAAHWLQQSAGHIDCLFLGSSMPDLDIDPDEFAKAYFQATGRQIVCYNLGLNLADAYAVGAITPILVEELHPSLLIYGTTARDYNSPALPPDQPDPIADTPWVQYRLGHWSLVGWLIDHSYSFRYFLRLANYSTLSSESLANRETGRGDYGYNPHPGQDPTFDPSAKPVVRYDDYQVLPYNLQGLKQLLALHSRDIQIVVVEMPVQPLHMQVFSGGQASYNLFVKAVSETTQDQEIGFWRMSEQDPIPPNGWWNPNHLNEVGAKVFSQWLGRRVALFAAQNPTTFITH